MDRYSPAHILIADDDRDTRLLLEQLLLAQGYEVSACADGAAALRRARERPPQLVVSDILMPELDGFGLCRALREDSRFAGMPFIFYTGTYEDPNARELARVLGVDRFLVKPLAIEEFLRVVHETLQEPASPSPVRRDPASLDRLHLAAVTKKLNQKVLQVTKTQTQLPWTEETLIQDEAPALTPQEVKQVCRARDLLMADLAGPPSLVDLAHRVGLNEKKLNRGFQSLYGMTVFSYLREERLQAACRLLSLRHLSMQAIAERVGYRHGSDFTTSFKQRFGVTPRQYRKDQGGVEEGG